METTSIDIETTRVLIIFAAGLMALVGGALTFINARLAEAKTPEEKKNVWAIVLNSVDAFIFLAGMILSQTGSLSMSWFLVS